MGAEQVGQRVDELERRLRALEDERDIAQLIARYGPLVDAGAATAAAQLWATDGSYTVEDNRMAGRAAVQSMVESEAHQRLIDRGSAHFLAAPVISVDADTAQAVCESLLCLRHTDGYTLLRATANHFRLARIDGRWQIVERTAHLLDGSESARSLLTRAVH